MNGPAPQYEKFSALSEIEQAEANRIAAERLADLVVADAKTEAGFFIVKLGERLVEVPYALSIGGDQERLDQATSQ